MVISLASDQLGFQRRAFWTCWCGEAWISSTDSESRPFWAANVASTSFWDDPFGSWRLSWIKWLCFWFLLSISAWVLAGFFHFVKGLEVTSSYSPYQLHIFKNYMWDLWYSVTMKTYGVWFIGSWRGSVVLIQFSTQVRGRHGLLALALVGDAAQWRDDFWSRGWTRLGHSRQTEVVFFGLVQHFEEPSEESLFTPFL